MNWNNELHEFHEFLFNTSQKIRLIREIRCSKYVRAVNRVDNEGVIADATCGVPTLASVILTANCRDVPWHVVARDAAMSLGSPLGLGRI